MLHSMSEAMRKFEVDANGQAQVMIRIGGHDHRVGQSKSCKTCNSPWRAIIEAQLLDGMKVAHIARALPKSANLSADNIREHRKRGHSPEFVSMVRSIMEQESGIDAEAYDMVSNYISFARVGLAMAMKAMTSGDVAVTIKDGIAFAKILQRAEEVASSDGHSADMEDVYADLFTVYYESVAAVCTDEQMSKINAKIESHPLMLKLRIAAQQRSEDWQVDALEEAS